LEGQHWSELSGKDVDRMNFAFAVIHTFDSSASERLVTFMRRNACILLARQLLILLSEDFLVNSLAYYIDVHYDAVTPSTHCCVA
jgi:hypothetical protein